MFHVEMHARGATRCETLAEARAEVARVCPPGLVEVLGDDGVIYYFRAEHAECEDAGFAEASISPL